MAPESSSASQDHAATVQVSSSHAPPDDVAPGRRISRYLVLGKLGMGAMGRVLHAYDPKLQREVAIKQVRADVLDDVATQRMLAEARAMAQISHPNVVSVYDVELLEDDGITLVMEFVDGRTLQDWLREPSRTWAEIVQVFSAAGRGLVAAHDAGLLHRDFKPANVLVSSGGDVKVTDFGLARGESSGSVGQSRETENALDSVDSLTMTGMAFGTPRYMAPEQHRERSHQLTPAADQYAFCVSLWESLCGEPPFTGADIATQKDQGPPRWSRTEVPPRIVAAIERGLNPDPARRWASMAELLAALAPSAGSRFLGVGVAVALLGTVGLAAGARYFGTHEAPCTSAEARIAEVWNEDRRAAGREAFSAFPEPFSSDAWQRTTVALDDYASRWARMHTQACEATVVQGVQSASMLDLRMACLERAKTQLAATAAALTSADARVVQDAYKLVHALPKLESCADLEGLSSEFAPPLPEDAEAVERTREIFARTKVLIQTGRFDQAREVLQGADPELEDIAHLHTHAEAALLKGTVLQGAADFEGAAVQLERAMKLAAQGPFPKLLWSATMRMTFALARDLARPQEASRLLPLVEGFAQGDPVDTASWLRARGAIHEAQGRLPEAEADLRAAIEAYDGASNTLEGALTRSDLSVILEQAGQNEASEAVLRQALELLQEEVGGDNPFLAGLRMNLSVTLQSLGRMEDAEREVREALRAIEAVYGAEHPTLGPAKLNLAILLRMQGKLEQAEATNRVALQTLVHSLGPRHRYVAAAHGALSEVLRDRGALEDAEAQAREALSIRLEALGPQDYKTSVSYTDLGTILIEQRRFADAEDPLERALAIRQKTRGPAHPFTAASAVRVADVRLEQGRHADALAVLRPILEADGEAPKNIYRVHWRIARALRGLGDTQGARQAFDAALAAAADAEPEDLKRLRAEAKR